MKSPSYVAAHAAKANDNDHHIHLNKLKDGIKLTILASIERDQRLQDLKKSIKKDHDDLRASAIAIENKCKQDHIMYDRFVKRAREDNSEMDEKYAAKCLDYLKLQNKYDELEMKYNKAMLQWWCAHEH